MQHIYKHIPNTLSYLRMIIACVVTILLFVPHELIVVQTLGVAGILSDKLDGALARRWNVESERGKKLESVADPMFNLILTIYVVSHLDFPLLIFEIGITLLAITVLGRLIVKSLTKKFFYEKSPVTRFATGWLYFILFFYLFQIPYRELLATAGLIYGVFVTLNYCRMMVQFVQRERSTSAS